MVLIVSMLKQEETMLHALYNQSNAILETDMQFGNIGNNDIFYPKCKRIQVNNCILRDES